MDTFLPLQEKKNVGSIAQEDVEHQTVQYQNQQKI